MVIWRKIKNTHTHFDDWGTLSWGSLFAVGLGLSLSPQTLQLGLLRLWAVFVQKTEQLGSRLSIEKVATELVDGWRHLQSLIENCAATLDSHISWPFEETGKIALGLDVAT